MHSVEHRVWHVKQFLRSPFVYVNMYYMNKNNIHNKRPAATSPPAAAKNNMANRMSGCVCVCLYALLMDIEIE